MRDPPGWIPGLAPGVSEPRCRLTPDASPGWVEGRTMSSDQTTPVILSACRTPIGRYLGGLAPLPEPRLGAIVFREAVRRVGIKPEVAVAEVMRIGLHGVVLQVPLRQ